MSVDYGTQIRGWSTGEARNCGSVRRRLVKNPLPAWAGLRIILLLMGGLLWDGSSYSASGWVAYWIIGCLIEHICPW
jgi:hypothetical protein